MNSLALIFLPLILIGCASNPQRWTQEIPPGQETKKILDVPFIAQEKNMCGPVVLKMATHFSAPQYSLTDLKHMTFREEAQGTFQSDILSAARRMGLTPYRVTSSSAMWQQIRDGRPVIVFQNLALSWLPAWHFSLIVGYDAGKDRVYIHTGTEALQSLRIKRFQDTWERGGKWSYVVTVPTDIPLSASFDEALENAMLLEKMNHAPGARQIYLRLTEMFPQRFEPHLGLAQLFYAQRNLKGALKESEKALSKKPGHPALLFNLSTLYFESGQIQKARDLKNQTLASASAEEKVSYEKRFSF